MEKPAVLVLPHPCRQGTEGRRPSRGNAQRVDRVRDCVSFLAAKCPMRWTDAAPALMVTHRCRLGVSPRGADIADAERPRNLDWRCDARRTPRRLANRSAAAVDLRAARGR